MRRSHAMVLAAVAFDGCTRSGLRDWECLSHQPNGKGHGSDDDQSRDGQRPGNRVRGPGHQDPPMTNAVWRINPVLIGWSLATQ